MTARWTQVSAWKEPALPPASPIQATLWLLAAQPSLSREILKQPFPPPTVKTSPRVSPVLAAARAKTPNAKLSVGRLLKVPSEYQPSLSVEEVSRYAVEPVAAGWKEALPVVAPLPLMSEMKCRAFPEES